MRKRQRFLSTLAIVIGVTLLGFLGLWYGYGAYYRWLDRHEPYLVAMRVATLQIPPITPTLTPTITPTPTEEPEPMPAVRVIIPKIGVNERVVETDVQQVGSGEQAHFVWETPAYAVGHRRISAHPGQQGNIVLSGHNNTLGEVFRNLDQLQAGDLIYLYTLDEEFVYVVQETQLVPVVGGGEAEEADHARFTARTPEETLTLISCWPYATFTHRIYVIAKPQGE